MCFQPTNLPLIKTNETPTTWFLSTQNKKINQELSQLILHLATLLAKSNTKAEIKGKNKTDFGRKQ